MRASLKLGRLFGVEIGLHYSWFIIAVLITLSLVAQFSATDATWGPVVVWTAATLTSILFFASIVVHELAHALAARGFGLPVRTITLFALGGLAQMDKEADTAASEFWIAIAGPITSLIIGIVCLAGAWTLGWSVEHGAADVTSAMLGWLGYINIALAVFNMIPGYPLDGGRVLRAVLWRASGDADRATRQAARTGQFVALVFIFIGLVRFFGGAGIGGLWIAFIGWFLLQASQASYARVAVFSALEGVRVADLMDRHCVTVDANDPVQAFVDDIILRSGQRCALVLRGGTVVGLVTPHEAKQVDRLEWAVTPIGRVMRPLDTLKVVSPATPVSDAFAIMSRENINQLPVMSGHDLQGIITRAHILELLHARAELAR
jgi:Zn-dependent protease/predicted transcriptional regulator